MYGGLRGLTSTEVSNLVQFQNRKKAGDLPMLPHGHPDANTLINMDQYDPEDHWPSAQLKFLETGAKPNTFFRDLSGVNNQVPQWAWLVLGGTFLLLSGLAYRNHRKSKKTSKKKK